jgi:hypothetical protein
MTELEQYLTSKQDEGLSPERLRYFGKQAARMFLDQEKPLNEAIAELAKEASLNFEQTKRVVEFANNETFAQLFKLGYEKNITFPMADASQVTQTNTTPIKKTASALIHKKKYIPGQEGVSLSKVFGVSGKVKEASGTPDISSTAKEFLDLKHKSENLSSELNGLGGQFVIKLNALEDLCKKASREGNSPQAVAAAISKANPSDGLFNVIKEAVSEFADFDSTEKLAFGGMAIQANPVTGLTQELEGMSQKLVMTQQAVTQVQMAMGNLLSILRGPTPMGASEVFGQPGASAQVLPAGPAQVGPEGPPPMAPPMAPPTQGPFG